MSDSILIKFSKYLLVVFSGVMNWCFGEFDIFLKTLLFLTVLDFITGILGGIYQKNLSSNYCFRGIIKKVMIYLYVALAFAIQKFTGDVIPLREIIISFYVFNEGISILENGGKILAYPPKLKEVLEQLKDGKKVVINE